MKLTTDGSSPWTTLVGSYGGDGVLGGKVDASFFYAASTSHGRTTSTISRNGNMPRNTPVIKNHRYYSGGWEAAGTILGNSQRGSINGVSITDLYICDYSSAGGCSGAPVYAINSRGGYEFIGMHIGKDSRDALVSKTANIEAALNVTILP